MEHNIITWNMPNWITVVLMVALFYLLIALIMQGLKRANLFNFGGGGGSVIPFPGRGSSLQQGA